MWECGASVPLVRDCKGHVCRVNGLALCCGKTLCTVTEISSVVGAEAHSALHGNFPASSAAQQVYQPPLQLHRHSCTSGTLAPTIILILVARLNFVPPANARADEKPTGRRPALHSAPSGNH